MSQTQTVVEPAGKSVAASIPYYDGPFNPPDIVASLTTARCANWQSVNVTDARPSMSSITLDKNGFQYVKHASALSSPPYTVASWKDHAIRERINDAEITELAKSVTGAKKVMILLATGRNAQYVEPENAPARPDIYANHDGPLPSTRAKGFYDGMDMGPVRKPHIDWGTGGIRSILREWSHELAEEAKDIIEAEDEAAKLPGGIEKNYKGRRWGFYNTWRPLKPVRRDPLGCVDYYSSKDDKSFIYWRDIPGIHGPFRADVPLTQANPNHKWYYLSDQQPDEVLFMRMFDSNHERDPEHVAGAVHHCSFHLPGTDGEEVRESIETKFMAFW
ncbi:hypothetical protein AK830_g10360 [Neonectria ditissima]|uniref:GA4 desaturase n=1 Tax=Neonectria ditissima TaxID=78410 RepID=A0A0P7BAM6_9HYPO|nr:hypothetical protein AK830_g10360 [Neonectria ditissima]